MTKEALLAGLKIIKKGEVYSHVVLNYEAFNALRGARPVLQFAISRNADNEPVRIFDVEGVKVYSRFVRDPETNYITTSFAMKTADAEAAGAILAADPVDFGASLFDTAKPTA